MNLLRSLSFAALTLSAACSRMVAPAPSPAPTPTPTPTPTDPSFCSFGDGSDGRGVLAIVDGVHVRYLHAGGSSAEVFAFTAPDSVFTTPYGGTLLARGEYVFANQLWGDGRDDAQYDDERVLLDTTGRVVWHRRFPNAVNGSWFLGSDGTVAFGTWVRGSPSEVQTEIIDLTGASTVLTNVSPVDAPGPDGVLAFNRAAPTTDVVWATAPYQTLDPMTLQPLAEGGAMPRWFDGRLVYFATNAGATVLVSALPGDDQIIDVPNAPATGFEINDFASRDWLLGSVDASHLVRVNLSTQSVEQLTVVPPDGQRPMTYADSRIMADGTLAMPMRTDSIGGIYLSRDGQTGWTRVGLPFANVMHVDVDEQSGTFVMRGANDLYVGEQWGNQSLPDGALSTQAQIARPASGTAYVIAPNPVVTGGPAPDVTLSADGLCAFWLTQPTGTAELNSIDAITGESHVIDRAAGTSYGYLAVWIGSRAR